MDTLMFKASITNKIGPMKHTEGADNNFSFHLLIVCVGSTTNVSSRVVLVQIFDKKHNPCVSRKLFCVNSVSIIG